MLVAEKHDRVTDKLFYNLDCTNDGPCLLKFWRPYTSIVTKEREGKHVIITVVHLLISKSGADDHKLFLESNLLKTAITSRSMFNLANATAFQNGASSNTEP